MVRPLLKGRAEARTVHRPELRGRGIVLGWVGSLLLAASFAAQPVAPATETEVPRLLRPGFYAIGRVALDQSNRTVSIPAVVNLRAGLVEYALVTTAGKIHESVFRTEAQPHDIHLAMLLLGVRAANTNQLPDDPHLSLPGQRIGIDVCWQRGRRVFRRPLADLITPHSQVPKAAPRDWAYNGSFLADGALAAQRGGSIVALITDASALVNNPRSDRIDDEVHQANTKALPPEETPVDIVFRTEPR